MKGREPKFALFLFLRQTLDMMAELQTISDAQGNITGVIVPIEMWREIKAKEVPSVEDAKANDEPTMPTGIVPPLVLPKGRAAPPSKPRAVRCAAF